MAQIDGLEHADNEGRIAVDEIRSQPRLGRGPIITFIALQCLDLLTTLAVFSRGGVELNPVVRSLMPWMGRLPAIGMSKVVLVSLVLMLSRRRWVLRFANVLYAGIVIWNVIVLLALH